MPQPTWLPPLNAHSEYNVIVTAHQHAPPPSSLPPPGADAEAIAFSITANVSVYFYSSDYTVDRTMSGLSIWKSFRLPSGSISTSDDAVSDVVSQLYIPFPLRSIVWESRRIDGVESVEHFDDDNDFDLKDELSDFLRSLVTAPCNAFRGTLAVTLTIHKQVILPASEFSAWACWYDEQGTLSESFVREYEEAISRPRNESESEQAPVSSSMEAWEEVRYEGGDTAEQCSICLEEFMVGLTVSRLPCSHVYHGQCVLRWLRRSNACPLCRYTLPISLSSLSLSPLTLPGS